MIKRNIIWVTAVLTIAAIILLLLHKPEAEMPLQSKPTVNIVQPSNTLVQAVASNFPVNQSQTANSKNIPIPADIEARYRQGLISKDEAQTEFYKLQFQQPQSFYGKIIDQYGQPIAGVEVTGSIQTLNSLDDAVENQGYKTLSDSEGMFEFTGKTGTPINVTLKKDGYLMGQRGEGYQGPLAEKTTPDNRAILTMWKLRGAEPLVDSSLDAKIPFDGTPIRFDIARGKQSVNGDLEVALIRSPLEVRRGRDKFNLAIKIEVIGGGIITENDPYPYWAPKSGYEPSFEFNVSSNDIPWHSTLTQNFYIKNAQGYYGRMQANVYSALTPARIQFNFTINPSASQNLEPATEK